MKCCYAFDRDWLRWSHWIFLTGKCPPDHSRPKASTNFQPDLVFQGWRGSGLPDLFAVGTSAGGISPTYQVTHLLGGRMKVPHLMWIRPMKCWSHAKRIFCDSVTCFGTNKCCLNGSHLPQCFIKALRFLLAWLLCFYTENPRIFFWKAIFATSPIVPAVTIHNLPWKMRVETCHLSFQYGILPGSFPFRAWCGDFQFRGCISTKTLSSKQGLLTGTSWNWRVCPLHAWQ